MRRWILIFVVAVQAAVLITLSGPMGATATTNSPSYNFKGKASVYYRTSQFAGSPYKGEYSPYFVVNFTCSNGQLSGNSNWTWDTSNETSYGGTLALAPSTPPTLCSLTTSSTSSGCTSTSSGWSSGTSMSSITLYPRGTTKTATLNLMLCNIPVTGGKTYVSNTTTFIQPTSMTTGNSGCVDNPGNTSKGPPPCIGIQTTGLGSVVGDKDGDFCSNPGDCSNPAAPFGLPDATAPYGTLTLSVG